MYSDKKNLVRLKAAAQYNNSITYSNKYTKLCNNKYN